MKILKTGAAQAGQMDENQLAMINRQTLRAVNADDVYVFRVVGCDDQPDRDCERFSLDTLNALAPLFVGKTVLVDHNWSANCQSARIYNAYVDAENGVNRLILCCYTLRAGNDATIAAIDAGILREVSVSCAVRRTTCSICGENYYRCHHSKGAEYDGKPCIGILEDPTDAYEVSFVAVPAQPGAGVVKSHKNHNDMLASMIAAKAWFAVEQEKWR